MKTIFASFLRRNLASGKIGILKELEYRSNVLIDTMLQPSITMVVEVVLWSSMLSYAASGKIIGFDKSQYIAYALWAAFFSRITANWMYEHILISDIERGNINSFLVRPVSFFEFYLSQFLGYKLFCLVFSFVIPLGIYFFYPQGTHIERLPLAIALTFFYLIFVFTLSFAIATCAFFFNKVHSFTVVKNISLWILSGELFPLDLVSEPYRNWLIASPFAAGAYIPVGYLTGRFGSNVVMDSAVSIALSLVVVGCAAMVLWHAGLRQYSGTAA